jgi:hypothetical protein
MSRTVYLRTDSSQDLHNGGELNTDASRASFEAAWCLAAKRIGRAAGVEVVADASGDMRKTSDYDRKNRAQGIDLGVVADMWQAVHDCVTTGSRNGRWIVAVKASTDKRGKALKAALKRPARDDE